MKTYIATTKDMFGYDTEKPIRLTVNIIGNTWSEPIGWKSNSNPWLNIPKTPKRYIKFSSLY